ncbi:Uncharacterized protein YgiD [Auxenochlorella protothecoides]|uniref:Uncharacterized protein YgiD n=2 Tax=Auxenochlorella protothecoides TaxID=3075 RepID=A0A087SB10_AUXPR|nr:Uncharacterized protein YgiD [Auxenochlorella protothecoides]KFM22914.1 Uncharacterized protein YgiD [Auxenochlorella protothecoides]
MANPLTRMPTVFVAHGSPMAALETGQSSQVWARLGKELPRPRAILCISAHWETQGTRVTSMAHPPTIHDFRGFPPALYDMQYPAPGDPALAREIARETGAQLDDGWGLDHGCWTLLHHMYPEAGIPVLQLSLDTAKTAAEHLAMGRRLRPLRDRGVLVLGSGNVVHNLRQGLGAHPPPAWATAVNSQVRSWVREGREGELVRWREKGPDFRLAINSGEHFLPLLYVLGAAQEGEQVEVFNDRLEMGSIAMTSYKFG